MRLSPVFWPLGKVGQISPSSCSSINSNDNGSSNSSKLHSLHTRIVVPIVVNCYPKIAKLGKFYNKGLLEKSFFRSRQTKTI